MANVETIFGWKLQKMAKVLIRRSAVFPDMFSFYCFNIPWSSFTEDFPKSSKHNTDLPFGHTEINLSFK